MRHPRVDAALAARTDQPKAHQPDEDAVLHLATEERAAQVSCAGVEAVSAGADHVTRL